MISRKSFQHMKTRWRQLHYDFTSERFSQVFYFILIPWNKSNKGAFNGNEYSWGLKHFKGTKNLIVILWKPWKRI